MTKFDKRLTALEAKAHHDKRGRLIIVRTVIDVADDGTRRGDQPRSVVYANPIDLKL